MATYTPKLNLKKPAGTEDINVADINENMDIIDGACGLEDISSHFTINATYCEAFKAYRMGHFVFVKMLAKKGTPDQTNVVTNISAGYRPLHVAALSTFWMNWGDASKTVAAYVMTSAIQVRTAGGAIEGDNGVQISGCYVI